MVTSIRTRGRVAAGAGVLVALLAPALSSCGGGAAGPRPTTTAHAARTTTTVPGPVIRRPSDPTGAPLPPPTTVAPFTALGSPDDGQWHPAGRPVDGVPAVYETRLVPPGGTEPAGIAWMDTHLLAARLYSGSTSPGGGPYRYTAPVLPAEAASLVAAFNGGFKMDTAGGGYVTEGRTVVPLVDGAASLVIRTDGTVDVGAWGTDVSMTTDVAAVRQNLVLLVSDGRPTAQATGAAWPMWGNTCGAASCAHSVPGVEQQWRSAVGVTGDGALVYVSGPLLTPAQLAQLLVGAQVVRGMELDINPSWTVLATYDPLTPGGLAAPDDGTRLVPEMVQGPATFFDPAWARDFVTMSSRASDAG